MPWREAALQLRDIQDLHWVYQKTPGYHTKTRKDIAEELRWGSNNGQHWFIWDNGSGPAVVMGYRHELGKTYDTPELIAFAADPTRVTWKAATVLFQRKIEQLARKISRSTWTTVWFPRTVRGSGLDKSIEGRYLAVKTMRIWSQEHPQVTQLARDNVRATLQVPI